MPPKIMDKYQKMLYAEHKQIPEFASNWDEFVEMWDDALYCEHDKLSIYYSVLLGTLRKVNAISEQVEHEPILLEMALVNFLSVWLKWGTGSTVRPGQFSRGLTIARAQGRRRARASAWIRGRAAIQKLTSSAR